MIRHPRLGLSEKEAQDSIRASSPITILEDFKDLNFKPLDSNDGSFQGNAKGWLPSGIFPLDWVMGMGAPKGRIIEIFGPEGVGKTTVTMAYVAAAQRLGGLGWMFDVEGTASPARFRHLGVQTDRLMYRESTPDNQMTLENVYNDLEKILMRIHDKYPDIPNVIVWDTTAATPPKRVLEESMEDLGMAEAARVHSKGMTKINQLVGSTNTVLFLVNQIREKIGFMAKGYAVPGGRAIKFYSSVRLSVRDERVEHVESGSRMGVTMSVEAVKNKVAPAYRKGYVDLWWDERGFDKVSAALSTLKAIGVFEQKGAYLQGTLASGKKLSFLSKDWGPIYEEHRSELFDILTKIK